MVFVKKNIFGTVLKYDLILKIVPIIFLMLQILQGICKLISTTVMVLICFSWIYTVYLIQYSSCIVLSVPLSQSLSLQYRKLKLIDIHYAFSISQSIKFTMKIELKKNYMSGTLISPLVLCGIYYTNCYSE